jgi:dTDP-4-amino-4,6-dideoxygalactose transaminase
VSAPTEERIGLGLGLRRQHAALLPELHRALDEIAASGAFVLGPSVTALEEALGDRVGATAVSVHSGTDALLLALRALDVGPGDEVILPAFSFFATVEAPLLLGATPVLVDVEPRTLLIDPGEVAARISPRTRAVIPVHLYGQCAAVEAIEAAIEDARRARRVGERGIAIIEDMAQALGAERNGRPAGSLGDLSALSFYPTKNLGALGDGGMVFARRAADAERIRRLRDHGSSRKYHHDEAGWNSRLDSLQAAFLLAKLPHLDEWASRRRAIAARFDARLRGLPVELPAADPANRHIYHLYTVRTPLRDALRSHLAELGIEAGVHYPSGLHRQPPVEPFARSQGGFPRADRAAAEVLSLPIFPEMLDREVDRVVEAVRGFPGFGAINRRDGAPLHERSS